MPWYQLQTGGHNDKKPDNQCQSQHQCHDLVTHQYTTTLPTIPSATQMELPTNAPTTCLLTPNPSITATHHHMNASWIATAVICHLTILSQLENSMQQLLQTFSLVKQYQQTTCTRNMQCTMCPYACNPTPETHPPNLPQHPTTQCTNIGPHSIAKLQCPSNEQATHPNHHIPTPNQRPTPESLH